MKSTDKRIVWKEKDDLSLLMLLNQVIEKYGIENIRQYQKFLNENPNESPSTWFISERFGSWDKLLLALWSEPQILDQNPISGVHFTHKKLTLALWLLLIGSVSFGIYKNFTAIDQHTVHEKEVIEQKIVDNNAIERYVENFAAVYFSWAPAPETIDQRTKQLENYFTEELQQLNADTIRSDSPTTSKVTKVQIWHLEQVSDNNDTKVTFSVEQQITEGEEQSTVTFSYHVIVHTDKQDWLLIIQNPTMDATFSKSKYAPKKVESDGTVDTATTEEITEFLETFFTLYPKATES